MKNHAWVLLIPFAIGLAMILLLLLDAMPKINGANLVEFPEALAKYGMIPEAVYTITSATFEKKKKKLYETPFGTFSYRDVPSSVFPLGQELLRSFQQLQ